MPNRQSRENSLPYKYAEVIVDIAHEDVDRVFDYIIPDTLAHIAPGFRVRVPFGPGRVEGFVMAVKGETSVPPNKMKAIESALDGYPALLPEMVELARWMQAKYHCRLVDGLRVMLPAEMRGGRVGDKNEKYAELAVSPEDAGRAMACMGRAPKQAEAMGFLLMAGGAVSASVLLEEADTTMQALEALQKKGLVTIAERRVWRRPRASNAGQDYAKEPTADQRDVLETLLGTMDGGSEASYLLHGITGCGKTEVYMQCAARALDMGRTVIILVPEIALTPQMTQRFSARFGPLAAVLHSRLSAGERYDEWVRIRQGEARVVIGARSAVFAPVQNLGFIVVDEEHETSFRSEHPPRYDALEVARLRASTHGAVYVGGSATPSLSSYREAELGGLTLLKMTKRIGGATLPEVEIVDLRNELASGNRGVMSARLVEEMRQCLASGSQAMLLLNRRGHSKFVSCRACGQVVQCPMCDVPFTYHSSGEKMKCHYCGSEQEIPKVCPACGSKYIRFFGDGTQKLEEEMEQRFPGVPVLRMDADTTRKKDGHFLILEKFRRGEARVLVGTQMIAKGLDFPDVTLVGVLAADAQLYMPDYRSAERAYQLMAQVAGRAGRANKPGRVLIQTYSTDHYAVQAAASHDYEAFYKEELSIRKNSQFPPFARLMRALFTNEDEKNAVFDARSARDQMEMFLELHPDLKSQVLLMEQTPAPYPRLNARYRQQLVLKALPGPPSLAIENALASVVTKPQPGGSAASLEIDPVSML
jgi:primosomal protein N' (replication factor Y) (superfamily II helicase)